MFDNGSRGTGNERALDVQIGVEGIDSKNGLSLKVQINIVPSLVTGSFAFLFSFFSYW